MTSNQAKTRHSPGRPACAENEMVCDRLLNAATELFSTYEYRAVSIRKIAAHAGVNTAMVHYYFGDKAGLHRSMMEQVSLPVERALNNIADHDNLSIAEFIKVWIQAMTDNPWYPIFIFKEGILGEDPTRQLTSMRLSKVMAPALRKALENDRKNGRLREDFDVNLVAMSLVSLLNFPFMARPLLEKTLGISFDPDQIQNLCDHTTDVFLHGVLESRESPRQHATRTENQVAT